MSHPSVTQANQYMRTNPQLAAALLVQALRDNPNDKEARSLLVGMGYQVPEIFRPPLPDASKVVVQTPRPNFLRGCLVAILLVACGAILLAFGLGGGVQSRTSTYRNVTYVASGVSEGGEIRYTSISGDTKTHYAVPPIGSSDFAFSTTTIFPWTISPYINIALNETGKSATCEIWVNGKQVAQDSATGRFATVTCKAP